jgi:hypothetical protein
LLSNGQVLVVGGNGRNGVLDSAELYNPATGKWTATGKLAIARDSHTATLLANGQVLVVGGKRDNSSYIASTELYDPSTSTWADIGALKYGRYWHTATLLLNGQVLIMGGYAAGVNAELSGVPTTNTPTATVTSTYTPTNTPTSIPTITSIATETSTPTPTVTSSPTSTYTATPTPVLLTATFTSLNVYDGRVLESGENTDVGGTMNSTNATFFVGDNATNRQYRGFLHFDTSSLPDTAIITAVTLRVRRQGTTGTDPFTTHGSLLADICKPYFSATVSLAVSDFQAAGSCQSVVATFGSTPVLSWYSAVMSNTWFSEIDLAGTTQFRLRYTLDDNNDAGADYMRFYSGNAAAATNHPQLIIQYYVP